MASPIRPQAPDAMYHITSRGNNRQAIFVDRADREVFELLLGRTVLGSRWLLHAYVQMTNHFHLVVQTPEPNLAHGMQRLNSAYAVRFNWRHRRLGHLFERRYHSELIETESHLLEACRYVVLNPHRAHMPDADLWPWSSYRATAGLAKRPAFLTVDTVLEHFSADRSRALELYQRFIAEGSPAASFAGVLAMAA
jgi:putative transposase